MANHGHVALLVLVILIARVGDSGTRGGEYAAGIITRSQGAAAVSIFAQ